MAVLTTEGVGIMSSKMRIYYLLVSATFTTQLCKTQKEMNAFPVCTLAFKYFQEKISMFSGLQAECFCVNMQQMYSS